MTLAYGLREEVPPTVTACWGARWIFPDDMLSDRQDFFGMRTPAGQQLIAWMEGKDGALGKSKVNARQSGLSQAETRTIVLYEDAIGIVKGNPKGSHGYLYVCAYLKADAIPVE